ncbi:MAG: ABC transporter ATP-binding protein [Acidimicrobiia bacterium]
MTALLEVAQAVVRFGATVALDELSLTVGEGEVLAVVGPSGSGKSTLLRAVAGLQPLDAGEVLVEGRPQSGVAVHRRPVGLMFQDHALFPHRDVAGNVGFGPRMAGVDRREIASRVTELLALVDLAGYGTRAISSLSGGEQQRVALARALAARPRLLLLDEPFGALDRPLRERLAADVRRIAHQLGLTVVAVTHDHREAFALADRVAVLDAGRILRIGRPAEVWQDPRSRRVAEVLGLPNLITATVVDGSAGTPWGALAVTAPDGPTTLHLPVPALALGPAHGDPPTGELRPAAGTVVASAFQGDRTLVRVALDGGAEIEVVAPADSPGAGDRVVVALDPAPVVVLEP